MPGLAMHTYRIVLLNPALYHCYLLPPSLIQGSSLTLVSCTSAALALPASFPHSTSLAHLHSFLETHGGGVRCQTRSSLPPTHLVGRSFWKNYSDICMCHGYKAPGLYPPTSPGFPCQPTRVCNCPSSLPLRHSFLKLLNMANCVRREAHFI